MGARGTPQRTPRFRHCNSGSRGAARNLEYKETTLHCSFIQRALRFLKSWNMELSDVAGHLAFQSISGTQASSYQRITELREKATEQHLTTSRSLLLIFSCQLYSTNPRFFLPNKYLATAIVAIQFVSFRVGIFCRDNKDG